MQPPVSYQRRDLPKISPSTATGTAYRATFVSEATPEIAARSKQLAGAARAAQAASQVAAKPGGDLSADELAALHAFLQPNHLAPPDARAIAALPAGALVDTTA